MNYQQFVAKTIEDVSLTGKKVAEDLAKLLDHETFQVTTGEESWVSARELLFNALCAFLTKQGAPLPKVEPVLWKSHLPKEASNYDKKREEFNFANAAKVARQAARGKRTKTAKAVRGMAEFLELFDDRAKGFSFREEQVIAMLSQLLDNLGAKPIRPDYSKVTDDNSANETAPGKSVRILIVDDEYSSIVKSAIALAGWPGVEIDFLPVEISREEKGTSTKEELLTKVAKQVTDRHPQVVLMDEGLCTGFNGHELIPVIQHQTDNQIWFVGNTGGNDDDLRAAGAHPNFEKGRDKKGMRRVLSCI